MSAGTTPAAHDTATAHGGADRRARPRRRPPVHITPDPSWTALGHYLASR